MGIFIDPRTHLVSLSGQNIESDSEPPEDPCVPGNPRTSGQLLPPVTKQKFLHRLKTWFRRHFGKPLLIEKYSIDDDPRTIRGNFIAMNNSYVDCHILTILGDMVVGDNAEVVCLELNVLGNLHLGKSAKIIVEGDKLPLIHGKIIMNQGTVFKY